MAGNKRRQPARPAGRSSGGPGYPAAWGTAAAIFFLLALGMIYILITRPVNLQAVLDVLMGLGGSLSILLPVISILFGVECARTSAGRGMRGIRKFSCFLFVPLLYAAVHIFSTEAILRDLTYGNYFSFISKSYVLKVGGGAIGSLLSFPFYQILGTGLGFTVILILMLLMLGITGLLGRAISAIMSIFASNEGDEEPEPPEDERPRRSPSRRERDEERDARDEERDARDEGRVPDYMKSAARARRPGGRTPARGARVSERDRERELYANRGTSDVREEPKAPERAPRKPGRSTDAMSIPPKAASPRSAGKKQADIGMDAFLNAEKVDLDDVRPARSQRGKTAGYVKEETPAPEAPVSDAAKSAPASTGGVADDLIERREPERPSAKPLPSYGSRRVIEEDAQEEEDDDLFSVRDDDVFGNMRIVETGDVRTASRADASAPKKAQDKPRAPKEPARTPSRPAPNPVVFDDEAEDEYKYPLINLLESGRNDKVNVNNDDDRDKGELLCATLDSFGISARLTGIAHGPAVTRFELAPAAGVKVSRITSLADDIALNLAARSVRIEAPIPGKAAVGVEIPNDHIKTVRLRDVLESPAAKNNPSKIAVGLGEDNSGSYIVADIAKMPHVLIAGQTGSGKSVCINSIIVSILYRATPKEVQLILIDPKVVELSIYNDIPHLITPVVTDPKKAASALDWAVAEMGRRYKKFADAGVRDIKGYNKKMIAADGEKMPQIVIVIDELADLMMVVPGEVEDSICRIAQLARACGMHLVIATQRPSVNVVTGIIKANIPSRIAFSVASQIDSRTMIDHGGAEKLLGNGDMLYVPSGINKPIRVQGSWVSDEEVQKVVDYVKNSSGSPNYDPDLLEHMEREDKSDAEKEEMDSELDDKLEEAIRIVIDAGQASTSMLQRKMRIGYARAGRLIDEMELRGIVSPANGAKPRDVLVTRAQYMEMFKSDDSSGDDDDEVPFDIDIPEEGGSDEN